MTLLHSIILSALFASSVYCIEKHITPKLKAHGSSTKDYWGSLSAHDLWEEFGDDWAGSSTLSDGSHNPNEIKGWGSASAGSWTQSKPAKPEADDQQQMQMPQQGQQMQFGQGQQGQYGGGMQYGYSSGGFGYSSGGYQQPQQPSYGYSSGGYSTGYQDQSGYSSAGFGYSSGGYSTGYDQSGYSSAGFSVPTGGSMGGSMPGGQQPMGAPQPGGSSMGGTSMGGMPQQPGGSTMGGMPAGGAMGGGMPGGKGMMPGGAGAGMAGQGAVSGKCPLPHRHRKPWALLTTEQKDMFIDGFQQVRKNGKLDVIAQTHGQHDIENYVHYTSLFAFYNAYLVWELESAIRDLGGKFACFTMPYYDWTLDAGLEDDPTILHSGIGGDGDEENDLCVTDDETGFTWQTCSDYSLWRTVDETTEDEGGDDGMVIEGGSEGYKEDDPAAATDENDDGGIHYGGYDDNIFKLSAMYMDYSSAYEEFTPGTNEEDLQQSQDEQDPLDPNQPFDFGAGFEGDDITDDDFDIEPESVEEQCYWTQANCHLSETAPFCCLKRKKSTSVLLPTAAEIGDAMYRSKNIKEWQGYLNEWQNKVHALFGADYYAHMANGYATEDPIFWLTQSFTVHLFSLWQDCWNYNNIPKDKLDMHYNSYHPYCGTFDAIPSNCVQFNLALDAPMNFYELQKAEWSMSYHKIITVRKMWTPDFWNVVYELGPFYTQSGVNNWCDNTRDSEWFIETMDYDVDPVKTPVNIFSKNLREQMIRDGAEPSGVFKTVGALSCRYNRKYSENSCWDDSMEDAKEEREVCDPDMPNDVLQNSTLSDFLEFDGIDENQCMKKIRRETYPFGDHSPQVKKQLCKGDWDYKCPEYNELLYGQYASFLDSPVDASAKKRHNNFFAKSGWIWMIVINGILVIIVAIGCGIWHCSRSKTVKIPLRDENGDITVEDDNDDGNTFGTIQTSQEVEEYQPLLV